MNQAERYAHDVQRGKDTSGYSMGETVWGEQWLTDNIGAVGSESRNNAAGKVRLAAQDRVNDGTIGIKDQPDAAERIARINQVADAVSMPRTGNPNGLLGGRGGNTGEPTSTQLNIRNNQPVDTSLFNQIGGGNPELSDPFKFKIRENLFGNGNQTSGAWDNGQGWTIWNPERGVYENYENPGSAEGQGGSQFRPGNGVVSYYNNGLGERVLGFVPSSSTRVNDGKTDGSTTEALVNTPNPRGNASGVTGKTWTEMNRTEQAAHVIARGGDTTQFSPEEIAGGQGWLTTNVGNTAQQTALFSDVRQGAADRARWGILGDTRPEAVDSALNIGNTLGTVDQINMNRGLWGKALEGNPSFQAQPEFDLNYAETYGLVQQSNTNWTNGVEDPELQAQIATPEFINTLSYGMRDSGDADPRSWYNAVNLFFVKDPKAYMEWAAANPSMAVKFHAMAAASGESMYKGWGVGEDTLDWDQKKHQDYANLFGSLYSTELGFGDDGKLDGRMIATSYDGEVSKDVNSVWGGGDWMKIGTPQKITDGLGNMIKDNPAGAVALAAAIAFAPALAGYVSGLVGTGTLAGTVAGAAAGGALVSAGGAAFSGEDVGGILESAVKGGLTGALTAGVSEFFTGADFLTGFGDYKDLVAAGLTDATGAAIQGGDAAEIFFAGATGAAKVKLEAGSGIISDLAEATDTALWDGAAESLTVIAFDTIKNGGDVEAAITAEALAQGVQLGQDFIGDLVAGVTPAAVGWANEGEEARNDFSNVPNLNNPEYFDDITTDPLANVGGQSPLYDLGGGEFATLGPDGYEVSGGLSEFDIFNDTTDGSPMSPQPSESFSGTLTNNTNMSEAEWELAQVDLSARGYPVHDYDGNVISQENNYTLNSSDPRWTLEPSGSDGGDGDGNGSGGTGGNGFDGTGGTGGNGPNGTGGTGGNGLKGTGGTGGVSDEEFSANMEEIEKQGLPTTDVTGQPLRNDGTSYDLVNGQWVEGGQPLNSLPAAEFESNMAELESQGLPTTDINGDPLRNDGTQYDLVDRLDGTQSWAESGAVGDAPLNSNWGDSGQGMTPNASEGSDDWMDASYVDKDGDFLINKEGQVSLAVVPPSPFDTDPLDKKGNVTSSITPDVNYSAPTVLRVGGEETVELGGIRETVTPDIKIITYVLGPDWVDNVVPVGREVTQEYRFKDADNIEQNRFTIKELAEHLKMVNENDFNGVVFDENEPKNAPPPEDEEPIEQDKFVDADPAEIPPEDEEEEDNLPVGLVTIPDDNSGTTPGSSVQIPAGTTSTVPAPAVPAPTTPPPAGGGGVTGGGETGGNGGMLAALRERREIDLKGRQRVRYPSRAEMLAKYNQLVRRRR
jgi:hypothetical protein